MELEMKYFIALLGGLALWRIFFTPAKNASKPARSQSFFHQERRGGPTPINPAKQAACKAARDAWLSNHGAVSVGATKRGDVYLCHGETSGKAL
jgi:hypothetical protein